MKQLNTYYYDFNVVYIVSYIVNKFGDIALKVQFVNIGNLNHLWWWYVQYGYPISIIHKHNHACD